MELKDIASIKQATLFGRRELFRLGFSLIFIIGIVFFANFQVGDIPGSTMLVIAAVIGAYMAINIGANDVANNVGPAVGSKALSLVGAILIATIFEAAGALIAGGDVISTIKKGIIDPSMITNPDTFIWLMMAALLAGAVWLNIATALGAPVSTTHSIVGAVLGAGIAAGGWEVANWDKMGCDCSKLGHFTRVWRPDCRRLPLPHQAQHHLSGRHDGGSPQNGSLAGGSHGVGIQYLPDPQRTEKNLEIRVS